MWCAAPVRAREIARCDERPFGHDIDPERLAQSDAVETSRRNVQADEARVGAIRVRFLPGAEAAASATALPEKRMIAVRKAVSRRSSRSTISRLF